MTKPVPADPSDAERLDDGPTRYHFEETTDGSWWLWREDEEGLDAPGNRAENNKIRSAAVDWGKRHGFGVESRTENRGAKLFLRFYSL